MKIALVNPPWRYGGSIYFGCREPHLPIELGCARAALEAAGHETLLLDAQLDWLDDAGLRERVARFAPDATVVTTAPTYLFWRCPPPELRVPRATLAALRDVGGLLVAVGPHGSTTPRATLKKLDVDAVVLGECEEVLPRLLASSRWSEVQSIAWRDGGEIRVQGAPHATDMAKLPPLRWEVDRVLRHDHHHHRFDADPIRPGAEVEATRGCPYRCSFCNKENFRSAYRKRPLENVLAEIDALVEQGVEYVYFIDEIFLPDRPLLEALAARTVVFGAQLRIDNWSEEMLDLLGVAGCRSIEAGVESVTPEGRSLLAKKCKATTEELVALLVRAKQSIPFVQANLLESESDDPAQVSAFRQTLRAHGVWANEPVPLFSYPGSPDYRLRFGEPDDLAWERAHADYLRRFAAFSDIQEATPRSLEELERD